jgi:hypothetical protein
MLPGGPHDRRAQSPARRRDWQPRGGTPTMLRCRPPPGRGRGRPPCAAIVHVRGAAGNDQGLASRQRWWGLVENPGCAGRSSLVSAGRDAAGHDRVTPTADPRTYTLANGDLMQIGYRNGRRGQSQPSLLAAAAAASKGIAGARQRGSLIFPVSFALAVVVGGREARERWRGASSPRRSAV